VSIAYIESDDNSCLKRLQSIVQLGCPVDQTRDLKTLLYCTASGKMKCVAFLMEQGVQFSDTDACMRVAALAVRYALESWSNIDSKKAREEMSWREKQGAILVSKGCPLLPLGTGGSGSGSGSGGAAAGAAGGAAGASGSGEGAAGSSGGDGEDLASAALAANNDPVYRYDPDRAKYTSADMCASVPVILGIREFTADYKEVGPGGTGRRFTTWKVAAKQKIADQLWSTWKTAATGK